MVDIPAEHKKSSPKLIRFYLVIVSTSLSENTTDYTVDAPPENDQTTPLVTTIIHKANYRLIGMTLIPDKKLRIQTELTQIHEKHKPDIIIFSGGTGVSPTDNTPEAIIPLLDKRLCGFEAVFQYLSYQEVGAASILSRATAGIYQESVVFALPGSPKAVQLALEKIILPEAGHLLAMVRRKS